MSILCLLAPSARGPPPQAPEDRHVPCPPGQGPPRLRQCRGKVWTEEGAHRPRQPRLRGPPSGRGRGHGEMGPSRCELCFSWSFTCCPVLSLRPRPSTACVGFRGACLFCYEKQWGTSRNGQCHRSEPPPPGSDVERSRQAGQSGADGLLSTCRMCDSPEPPRKGHGNTWCSWHRFSENTDKCTEHIKTTHEVTTVTARFPLCSFSSF